MWFKSVMEGLRCSLIMLVGWQTSSEAKCFSLKKRKSQKKSVQYGTKCIAFWHTESTSGMNFGKTGCYYLLQNCTIFPSFRLSFFWMPSCFFIFIAYFHHYTKIRLWHQWKCCRKFEKLQIQINLFMIWTCLDSFFLFSSKNHVMTSKLLFWELSITATVFLWLLNELYSDVVHFSIISEQKAITATDSFSKISSLVERSQIGDLCYTDKITRN